jgi:hypothetical protein
MEMSDRLKNIHQIAEDKATLQRNCLNDLDLDSVKKEKGIGKLKFLYDKCIKENSQNYEFLQNKY